MKASELRIGNYCHYKINNFHIKMNDLHDVRKEWLELCIIDVGDLNLLINNPDDPDFIPIEINEQWLIHFGFQIGYTENFYWNNVFGIKKIKDKYQFIIGGKHIHIQYVHQLQNLFFALTGIELTKKI